MALDNFNRQEITDEVQELHNLTDKQAQNIEFSDVNEALENHEKMMKTFEINKTNFPDNNFQAVKNVFKNILEVHNFNYGVESKKNKGTTFFFDIPKTKK